MQKVLNRARKARTRNTLISTTVLALAVGGTAMFAPTGSAHAAELHPDRILGAWMLEAPLANDQFKGTWHITVTGGNGHYSAVLDSRSGSDIHPCLTPGTALLKNVVFTQPDPDDPDTVLLYDGAGFDGCDDSGEPKYTQDTIIHFVQNAFNGERLQLSNNTLGSYGWQRDTTPPTGVDCDGNGTADLTQAEVDALVAEVARNFDDYPLPAVAEFKDITVADARAEPCQYVAKEEPPAEFAVLPDPGVVAGADPLIPRQNALLGQFVVPVLDAAGRRVGVGFGVAYNGGQVQPYSVLRFYGTSGVPVPTYEWSWSGYPVLSRNSVTATSIGSVLVDPQEFAARYNMAFPGGTALSGYSGARRKPGGDVALFSGAAGSFGNDAARVAGQVSEYPNPGLNAAAPSPYHVNGTALGYKGGQPLRTPDISWLGPNLAGVSTITIPLSSAPTAFSNLWNKVQREAKVAEGTAPTSEQGQRMTNMLAAELEASPATLKNLTNEAWKSVGGLLADMQELNGAPSVPWPTLPDLASAAQGVLELVGRAIVFMVRYLCKDLPAFAQ
jgi:hypothetical protein